MVTAAHEGDVGERVQVSQYPDAVHHNDRGGRRVLELRQPDGTRQLEAPGHEGDAREVIGVGLVGREDEAGGGHLGQQVREGREHDRLVARPRGPGDDGERVRPHRAEAEKRLARAIEALGALHHAVVACVARHLNRLGPGAQRPQPPAVFLADRADAVERAVGGLGPLARRPAQPRAVRGDRGGDEPELHAAARRGERQLGPHVQLREHQGRGLEGREHRADVARSVKRQVVGDVRRQRAGEAFRRGREERVGELPLWSLGAQRLQYRLRLQAFAHRRRVHPHERTLGVAVGARPRGETLGHAAPRFEPTLDLLVEAGGEREGPLREGDAEPVHEGRAGH